MESIKDPVKDPQPHKPPTNLLK